MRVLLGIARAIDLVNERIGRIAVWLVLLACLVSAANAVSRYALDLSSNAWLELQWYMFTAMVMFGAPYVLNVNGHVRVDILYGQAAPRTPQLLPSSGPDATLRWTPNDGAASAPPLFSFDCLITSGGSPWRKDAYAAKALKSDCWVPPRWRSGYSSST